MIKDILESCRKNLSDKIISPFYGAFIVSWSVWNWKIWYITFFIDSNLLSQKNNILKLNYILSFYPSSFFNIFHLFVLPFASAWFFIYIFPKITIKFYEKSLENENKIRKIKLEKEKDFLEKKEAKLEVEKKIIKKEAEVGIEKEKSEKSREKIWDEEYDKFKETKYFQFINQLKSSIYSHSGRTFNSPLGGHRQDIISTDIKAYLDANKIIELDKDKNGYERAILTEKGKHFMKKYTDEEKL
jgi:hypothetical protein